MFRLDTGGPVSPTTEGNEYPTGSAGMTLFDYYAGLALQGVLANPTTFGDARMLALLNRAEAQEKVDQIGECAVIYAHALMKARAKYLALPYEPRIHSPEED
jgi:hypothetical protein